MNRRYIQDVLSNFRWRLLLSFMAILVGSRRHTDKRIVVKILQKQLYNLKFGM